MKFGEGISKKHNPNSG